jgi:two-component system chemotaxis response regulator CheY
MRILVVDDEYVSRTKLKTILGRYGDCDAAGDGEMALEMIGRAFDEGVPYDLVTMDINMPGLSGQEVVSRLRDWEQENRRSLGGFEARVLMITAQNTPRDVMSSFSRGAEWFLPKPVTPEKIDEALKKIDFEQRDPADTGAPAGRTRPLERPSDHGRDCAVELKEPAEVDLSQVQAEFWGEYMASTVAKLEELEQAGMELESSDDPESVRNGVMRLLHSLKGEAGMIGLMDVQAACHETETIVKEADDPASMADTVLEVRDWIAGIVEHASGALEPA